MHFRPMRVNADLDRLNPDFSEPCSLPLANHDRVRLELYTKLLLQAGILEDLEEVFSQKDFAAAEGQNEDSGVCQFIQQMLDLYCRHLTMVVMIEIAMHTAFIATIRKVELHAERDVQRESLFGQLMEQAHHLSPNGCLGVVIGVSEICRIS